MSDYSSGGVSGADVCMLAATLLNIDGGLLVGHHFLSVELDRLLQLLVKPLDHVAVLALARFERRSAMPQNINIDEDFERLRVSGTHIIRVASMAGRRYCTCQNKNSASNRNAEPI